MEDWQRYGYASYEAFISAKAGACPPKTAAFRRQLAFDKLVEHPWEKHDWPEDMEPVPPPFTPPDDEGSSEPGARDE